jgi:hypothetical protein
MTSPRPVPCSCFVLALPATTYAAFHMEFDGVLLSPWDRAPERPSSVPPIPSEKSATDMGASG